MKKDVFLGITAAVVIGLVLVSCGGGGTSSFGDELSIDADVWVVKTVTAEDIIANPDYAFVKPYEKSTLVSADVSAFGDKVGAITNGRLKATIGEPLVASLGSISGSFGAGATIDPATVKGTWLNLTGANFSLDKGTEKATAKSDTSGTVTINYTGENVNYIYVDADVTITSSKPAWTETQYGVTVQFSEIKATTITLKKGWNAIYNKTTVKGSITGDGGTGTGSQTGKAGDSGSVYWVLE